MDEASRHVVFFNTGGVGLRPISPILQATGLSDFYILAERELTMRYVAKAFLKRCREMVLLAKDASLLPREPYKLDGYPYSHFGTIKGQESLLREVEYLSFTLLFCVVSLRDIAGNAVVKLKNENSHNSNEVWPGISKEHARKDLKERFLSSTLSQTADADSLDKIFDLRNDITHAHNLYASVILPEGKVLLTKTATDFGAMSLNDPKTLSHDRLLNWSSAILRFIDWFIQSTEEQLERPVNGSSRA